MGKLKSGWSLCLSLSIAIIITLGVCLPISLAGPSGRSINYLEASAFTEQVEQGTVVTGASTAARDYKGGAVFLEPNTTLTMSGGTITGHSNVYGGAIYVSNGATFTMTGGTISSNTATYGGAIYVEAGGKCYIQNGTITQNKADSGAAIFVEEGGTLQISTTAVIEKNKYNFDFKLLNGKIMGGTYKRENETFEASNVRTGVVQFGSYPQHYVSDENLRTGLENWYVSQPVVGEYNIAGNVFLAYKYTDGNIYVRGLTTPFGSGEDDATSVPYLFPFEDGTIITRRIYTWFKVEPLTWFALNAREWTGQGAKLELWSEFVLAAMPFNSKRESGNAWDTSEIRAWLNNEFLNTAFTKSEQKAIEDTSLKTGGMGEDDVTDAIETVDKIYLKSFYELNTGLFDDDDLENFAPTASPARLSHGSDFAVATGLLLNPAEEDDQIQGYKKVGMYWTRSKGAADSAVCTEDGNNTLTFVNMAGYGVRPALVLNVSYEMANS